MKKIVSAIITICMIITGFPVMYASEVSELALYSLSVTEDMCILTGGYSGMPYENVSVTLGKSGSDEIITAETMSDHQGLFEIEFVPEYVLYTVNITMGSLTLDAELDLSGVSELLAMTAEDGYDISSVSFFYDTIKIEGTHSGTAEKRVSLKATAVDDEDDIKGLSQGKADENCNFIIDFLVLPGEYDLYLKTEGVDVAKCKFKNPDIELVGQAEPIELDYDTLMQGLNSFAQNLDELIKECEDKNISTDYESANLEIIKRFIELIKNEAAHNDLSRIEQYSYELTKIYNEARKNLKSYLKGEKTPFKATKYITSDIKTDGVSLIAQTETDGATEEKPVFLTGFGHFDTALNDAPFFSKIGFSSVQYELPMNEVFKEVSNWERVNKNRWVEFGITDEEYASGGHSFEIEPITDGYDMNYYSALTQTIKVKPLTNYKFGFKAKASGLIVSEHGSASLCLHGKDPNKRYYIENSADWKSYDFTYRTQADETELNLWILGQNDIETLYIDDVYLMKEGTDVDLVTNGDFEAGFDGANQYDEEAQALDIFIDYDRLEKFHDAIEVAEDNNVLVDVMLAPHHMPEFILKSDAEATTAGKGFLPFNIENETVKKTISLYGRLVASVANDCKAVQTMCLTNEPTSDPANSEYFIPLWQEYLKTLYDNDITNLNKAYDNNDRYASFEEVEMPTYMTRTPRYNDYRNFNDELLLKFHSYLVDEVKSEYPDLKLHIKILQYFRYWNYQSYYNRGTNYELHSDIMDVNGGDASNPFGDTEGHPTTIKMAWYDMMTSIDEKPVFDTESHVVPDGTEITYPNGMSEHVATDVWMGAVHGRANTVMWFWDLKDQNMPWKGNSTVVNSNMVLRPMTVAHASKTALDLNRLAEEITAIQKADRNVGILYSRISAGYSEAGYTDSSKHYMKACGDAYEQTLFNGQKVKFVIDSNPEAMNDCELLIIPLATNVKKDMLDSIKTYLDNGGKVLLTGEDSLKYNEYDVAHDTVLVNYIYNHENTDTTSSVADKIEEMELSALVLMGTDGNSPDKTEWSYTKYNDGYLVNMVNYGTDTKNITISLRGRLIGDLTELRSGNVSDTIELESMQPQLIYFSTNTFDLLDENNNVKKENVDALESGRVKYNTEAVGSMILALYKGETLVKIVMGTDIIDITIPDDENIYTLKAMVWDMTSYAPVTGVKSIRN